MWFLLVVQVIRLIVLLLEKQTKGTIDDGSMPNEPTAQASVKI